jgi:nucleic acid/nucleotide deaminase of polymorphic system toxin
MAQMAVPYLGSDWSVEDRIAAMLAAVIYTSDHIDLVRVIPALPSPPDDLRSQKKKSDWIAAKKQEAVAGALSDLDKAAGFLIKPTTPGNPNLAAITTVKELPAYSEHQFVYHTLALKGAKPLAQQAEFSHDISEIDYDTVSVVIFAKILYVACNYKLRSTKREGDKFEIKYLSFGQVSETARGNVMRALRDELGKDAKDIASVVFVGLKTKPEDETEGAAPHAEMQLMSHLSTAKLLPDSGKLYFGVSKACCENCAGRLAARAYKYRDSHKQRVTNWEPPEDIKTVEVSREKL